jgi:SAM-dependent methyltransferase
MHDTAYRIGKIFLEIYMRECSSIVELGSMNINGTLRDFAHQTGVYLGLDTAHGCGVDIVIEPGKPLPIRDCFCDLVVTTSVFEHDCFFWETFLELGRILKNDGALYINAPSNGIYHRYPFDCWRFYPESGLALEKLARKSGYALTLIESFIAKRETDNWNDFVAIYIKSNNVEMNKLRFISDQVPCNNVIRYGADEVLRQSKLTEDMQIIRSQNEEISALRASLEQSKPPPERESLNRVLDKGDVSCGIPRDLSQPKNQKSDD